MYKDCVEVNFLILYLVMPFMIGTWVSGFFFIFLIGTMTVLFFKITVPQVPSWWKRTDAFIPQQPTSLFKLGTKLFTLLEDLAISCEWFLCFGEHDKKVFCLGLTSLLSLPADQLPAEALRLVFKAALVTKIKLQVSLSLSIGFYKNQVAGLSLGFY